MTRRDVFKVLGGFVGLTLCPINVKHLLFLPDPGTYLYGRAGNMGHVKDIWRVLVAGKDLREGMIVSWAEGEFMARPYWKIRFINRDWDAEWDPSRVAVATKDVVAGERFLGKVRGSCFIRMGT